MPRSAKSTASRVSAHAGRRGAAPRRRGKSIRWDRVGRTSLLVVLGVILLLYISPVSHWVEQSQTAGHQRDELERLEREHDELKERVSSLRGPDAIEREARRLGMVRAGERAIVVEGLPE